MKCETMRGEIDLFMLFFFGTLAVVLCAAVFIYILAIMFPNATWLKFW